ncbi:hypothetical protein BBEV_3183 [Salisediminibacterium beveridgei]|uniref:Uncharacterized protein n=1 Tax=Salisediminibacterium beveridgei TaxID=632773 RepID=A0A1D7QZR6_9BACI|nr:hypothetical protein BBEV_3183 [Salisediminibacterium beveridgei]
MVCFLINHFPFNHYICLENCLGYSFSKLSLHPLYRNQVDAMDDPSDTVEL